MARHYFAYILGVVMATSAVQAEPTPPPSSRDEGIVLHLFGYAFPFLFDDRRVRTSFRWGEITGARQIGIGILSENGKPVGEVVGVDGTFWGARFDQPTPAQVKSDDTTVFGIAADLEPANTNTLQAISSKAELSEQLDELFVDTEVYVYVAEITGRVDKVEYILQGAPPDPTLIAMIEEGRAEEAIDRFSPNKKTAEDVDVTIVAVRAPTTLFSMFEVPYHTHFVSSDRTLLGHLSDVAFESATVRWARVKHIEWEFWPRK